MKTEIESPRAFHIGVMIHSDFGVEKPHPLGAHLEQWVRSVEEFGIDAIHIPTEIGWHRFDPLVIMGAIAAWTERVEIGTAALLAPMHDPMHLAEAVTSAQLVSNGRIVLGLGLGWREQEFRAAGLTLRERRGRLEEHLSTLPDLLRGEVVTQHGKFFDLEEVQVALAEGLPRTPILLASHGRRGITRAATHADGWIAGPFVDLRGLERQCQVFWSEMEVQGRSGGRLAVMRECVIAPTDAEADAQLRYVHAKYQEYARRIGDMAFDPNWTPQELASGRFISGSPETCAMSIVNILQRTLATDLILRTQFRGMDPSHAVASLRTLGEEVIPRVHEMLRDSTHPVMP